MTKERDSGLFRQVFTWLKSHWAPVREGLTFELSDRESWVADILKEEGLSQKKQTGHEWKYDITAQADAPRLAGGWEVVTLVEEQPGDIKGIAEVIKAAFNSTKTEEELVEVLENLKKNPLYRPELSVFTRNREGRFAAYCRGTVNPATGVAAIDPVCCHPDFQRQGMTTAVVQECFRRQALAGGKVSYIGSAPIPAPSTFFYRSLAPVDYLTMDRWSLEVG